tara:strand:+ start:18339 stop:18452 length:114 start_codon:yes stop_codon:yes gene_type:complete
MKTKEQLGTEPILTLTQSMIIIGLALVVFYRYKTETR